MESGIFFFFLVTVTVLLAQDLNPIARLSYGLLKGSWKISLKGRPFASFEGVPYASPPIGKYRFREPQPLKPWLGTWDATKPLSACLQYEALISKKTLGSEDCLFLNVYTPTVTPDKPLPVVVFIHGGAFLFGQSIANDPSYIMDRNLVVVTINYRLGVLGFLSTGDEVIPGNIGLKDQSAALHWIRNNVMMFGGNPDSITLTGFSAGGASVHYHYLSPLSKGTFHRGIAFSGSAFSPRAYSMNPAEKAKALADIVGCPTTTSQKILECLSSRPAEVIVKAQIGMCPWRLQIISPFLPTTEAPGTQNPFLSHYPYHVASTGTIANVPLITSVTSEEGLFPASTYLAEPNILSYLETHWETLANTIFLYNDTLPTNERVNVAKRIKKHYLDNKPVSQETFLQLVQAITDRLFVADLGKMAQLHALRRNQPVYVYRFSYRGTTSLTYIMAKNNTYYGVCHGDDVAMIFKSMTPGREMTDPKDLAMVDVLVNMVYTYASTGVPTLSNSCSRWTPIRPGASEIDYLEIISPTKSEMRSTNDFGQRSFWDGLGFNENEKYHPNVLK